ncbi:hypothetical protein LTR86_007782 [Recurvomyces mirabilis]|nr:hypothetical protein LTR86_007782 [Recurvomyces mirabilis]
MVFGKNFLRHHISKLSLRKKKSCISVATQDTAASAAPSAAPPTAPPTAPTQSYSNPPHGQGPSESDDNSEKKPLLLRLLKKQPSIPASLKTLYTPHSRYNSAETLERDVREDQDNQSILTRIQTNTSTATAKVGGSAAVTPKPSESTIATTPAATPYPSTTVTPQPSSSIIRETAIEREEALARWRASSNPSLPAAPPPNTTTTTPAQTRDVGPKQVYPESSGRHNREMEHLPESQRQEDHAYPAAKPGSRGITPATERGLGSGTDAGVGGGRFATKADRIRALEEQAAQQAKAKSMPTRKPLPGLTKPSAQDAKAAQELRIKRREMRVAAPPPESPLYRSQPDDEPYLHTPKPTKHIPILQKSSPELTHVALSSLARPAVLSAPTSTGATSASTSIGRQFLPSSTRPTLGSAHLTSPYISNTNSALLSPSIYLSGTREKCVRHGRKHKPTQDSISKGRTGAYHPTGLVNMRQMEATSPWIGPDVHFDFNVRLSGSQGSSSSEGKSDKAGGETCPDCKAELGIRRKEEMWDAMRPVREADEDEDGGVAGTSTARNGGSATSVTRSASAVMPAQKRALVEHEQAPTQDCLHNVVVPGALGQDIYAAVMERDGVLERVVVNNTSNQPYALVLQRLSEELLAIADTLAHTSSKADLPALHVAKNNGRDRTVLMASDSHSQSYSVSELLDLVGQAVDTMHDSHKEDSTPEPLVHSETFHDARELNKAAQDHFREEHRQGGKPATSRLGTQQASKSTKVDSGGAADSSKPKPELTKPSGMPAPATSAATTTIQSIVPTIHKRPPTAADPHSTTGETNTALPSPRFVATSDIPTPTPTIPSTSLLPPNPSKNTSLDPAKALLAPIPKPPNLAIPAAILHNLDLLEPALGLAEQLLLPIAKNPRPYHRGPGEPSKHLLAAVEKQFAKLEKEKQTMRNGMRMETADNVAKARAKDVENEVLRKKDGSRSGSGLGWLGVWRGGGGGGGGGSSDHLGGH